MTSLLTTEINTASDDFDPSNPKDFALPLLVGHDGLRLCPFRDAAQRGPRHSDRAGAAAATAGGPSRAASPARRLSRAAPCGRARCATAPSRSADPYRAPSPRL